VRIPTANNIFWGFIFSYLQLEKTWSKNHNTIRACSVQCIAIADIDGMSQLQASLGEDFMQSCGCIIACDYHPKQETKID